MKPSERRALMEEKERLRKEASAASAKESISSNESVSPEDLSDCDVKSNHTVKNKKGKSVLDDGVESTRKEGFFQSNVKLITFIITVSLLFMVIGPVSVIRRVELVEESRHYKDGKAITVEEIKDIANAGAMIQWSDFDGYGYEDQSTKKATVREYYVADTGYFLVVRGDKNDKVYPDNVHLMYSDDNGTTFIDLRTDNINEFLRAIEAAKEEEILIPMTLEDLENMLASSTNFTWANMSGFKCESSQRVQMEIIYYVRTYRIMGTDLSIVLEGRKISGYPEKVTLINGATLEEKDMKRDDISDFIKEYKDKE